VRGKTALASTSADIMHQWVGIIIERPSRGLLLTCETHLAR
jgi:hypothetical protein